MLRRSGLSVAVVAVMLWTGRAGAAAAHMAHDPRLEVLVKTIGILIVAAVFVYCVTCFLRPGEDESTHIKRRILRSNW